MIFYYIIKYIKKINSYEKYKRDFELDDKYKNEKEIKEKYKINNKIILFSYFYKFKKEGKYTINYSFRDNITKLNPFKIFFAL